jgi:hypothetical protein
MAAMHLRGHNFIDLIMFVLFGNDVVEVFVFANMADMHLRGHNFIGWSTIFFTTLHALSYEIAVIDVVNIVFVQLPFTKIIIVAFHAVLLSTLLCCD